MSQIVAFSGGKDSTALALRLHELGEDFELLFTATGNELPDCLAHIDKIVAMTGKPLVRPENKPLEFYMEFFKALPNWRQRWCTRLIKIVPCIAYLNQHPGSTLTVGLRADEEHREGLYGDYAKYRYPLREWGWGVNDVWAYLKSRDVTVPTRTDCAWCYGQRLAEWYALWRDHPDVYRQGEEWEAKTGHTFRSRGRDTWPAPMAELRREFESGRTPKGVSLNVLFEDDAPRACRVCSL